jgi:hypothetical protein
MIRVHILFLFIAFSSCKGNQLLSTTLRHTDAIDGSAFFQQAAAMNWQQRDSFAIAELLAGNLPDFLRTFVPLHVSIPDSVSNKKIKAVIYVAPDYLSVGSNDDWARIPLTPMAAQMIADRFHCFCRPGN